MTNSNTNVYKNLLISVEDKALLFQAALDQAYSSVVITDANTSNGGPHIIYANPAFEKMTGYSLNELLGKSPKILQGPLTNRIVIEEMRICMHSGNYFEGSTINYKKDGQPYNVEWSISPIKDSSGGIEYFISVQKNITTFIKAQQERNLLAKALNDSPDCVIITDSENKIVFVNTGFEQLTGFKQDEVIGESPSFLWGTKSDFLTKSLKQGLLNPHAHFKMQEPNVHKDGSLFFVDQSFANITDETGTVTHYVSFSKDSTDRLKQELALKKLASRDPLTDLLNRRSGEQLLKKYDDVKRQLKKRVCLIMMDIDNFKRINDTYGHTIGDRIIILCSELLKNKARNIDSIVRWGGEEFLIIIQDSRLVDACKFAERIRKSIEKHNDLEVGSITASFGVAEINPDESTASLLNRADKALYKAKLDGKNCVKSAN